MYYVKKLVELGIDFKEIAPELQQHLRDENFLFDLDEIVQYIKVQSNNFQIEKPELLAIDAKMRQIYENYGKQVEVEQEPPVEVPTPEPIPEPAPEPEENQISEADLIRQEIQALQDLVNDDMLGFGEEDIEYFKLQIEILTDSLEFI
jgi:hypothetical protein